MNDADKTRESVLITGANRGIGLELVRQYAQDGWRVYACCRSPENALDLNRLAADGAGCVSVHLLDVTKPQHIEALRAYLAGQPIDVLINNAGIYGPENARFGNTGEESWVETFRVNSIAPMKIMEALLPNVAMGRGRIIASLSSKMGSMGDNASGGSYIYRSSKAALNAVMKSASIDLLQQGVTCVVLHPGWVLTDMGGPDAEMRVEDSVRELRRILARVEPGDAGRFFDIDGTTIPW